MDGTSLLGSDLHGRARRGCRNPTESSAASLGRMVAAGWTVVCRFVVSNLALGANVAASWYWERAGAVWGVNGTGLGVAIATDWLLCQMLEGLEEKLHGRREEDWAVQWCEEEF